MRGGGSMGLERGVGEKVDKRVGSDPMTAIAYDAGQS